MSVFFKASEIIQFAIKIEENGEKFYRYALQITENYDIKKIFEYLAEEETKHKNLFEDLLLNIKKYKAIENYPGQYIAHLQAYVENYIFKKEFLERKLSRIKDTLSAINFGIQRELDSLLYYHEIKNFVPKNQHRLIDKIIDEERNHFSKLSEIKKDMVSSLL